MQLSAILVVIIHTIIVYLHHKKSMQNRGARGHTRDIQVARAVRHGILDNIQTKVWTTESHKLIKD
jgi:hypothetical protein